ncbi:MAG: glycosyltransferase family 39 protein [Planctomycetota bacterium]|nr:glycosyltransferase family 39 protein [Planctomycetota bacterium]
MAEESQFDKPSRAAILAVAVCALLIRVAFVVAMADSLDDDPDAYRRIAENLRRTGVYGSTFTPTAFRPPLYPVLLAGLAVNGDVTPSVVGGLHVLCGVATVVLTFLLGCRWRLGRWAFVAAALVAIDPILLNQSALVMTETLATLLAAAGLFALSLWSAKPSLGRALVAGVVFGLACLCRPTFIPWLALSALAMIVPQYRVREPVGVSPLRRAIGFMLAFLLSAALVISPWVLRNYCVFGVPKATTTHGGYTVLLGNNPSFYRYLREAPRGTTWDAAELADAWELRPFSTSPRDAIWELSSPPNQLIGADAIGRSEFEDDAFAYSLARRYIADEPEMFVYSCLVRVSRLWQIVPYRTSENESTARMLLRGATGCWYSVLFVLAMVAIVAFRSARGSLFAQRSTTLVWGLLLCITFSGVHAMYWSNMRMRAPLTPFLCLLAASGAAWISTRLGDRKP